MFFTGKPSARWIGLTTLLVLFAGSTTAFIVGAWRSGGAHLVGSAMLHAMAFGLGAAFLVSATVRLFYPALPMTFTSRDGQRTTRTMSRGRVIAMFAIGVMFYAIGTAGGIVSALGL